MQRKYHVERYLREVMIPRIAPISPQLCLSLHRRESFSACRKSY
jgi:hypothetical protein